MVKVTIDRPECISCESCWIVCPEVFEQNPDDEFSEITEKYRVDGNLAEGEIPEDLADCAWAAADSCPVAIIFVEE